MNPENLRIGNYVYFTDFPVRDRLVKLTIDEFKNGNYWFEYFITPIPLTEQWLIDFGFKFNKENNVYDLELIGFVFKHKLQYSLEDMKIWIIRSEDDFVNLLECKYVHQLQNLYYALIGKELTKQ